MATIVEQDLAGAPDERLLQVCVAEERVLVTLDLDFANPLRFDPQKTSGIPGSCECRRFLGGVSSDIAGRLWVVARGRVRQYEPGSRNGGPVNGSVNEAQP